MAWAITRDWGLSVAMLTLAFRRSRAPMGGCTAALVFPGLATCEAGDRPVLGVPLEHRVGRDRRVLHVALGRVWRDHDVDLGLGVAVHDVERDAVKGLIALSVLSEVGVEPAVAVEVDDVVDDRRR